MNGNNSTPNNFAELKTSDQWWTEVKANPEKLTKWLKKQYHGEITAHQRINKFIETFLPESPELKASPQKTSFKQILTIISDQELTHAQWVGELLQKRGIEAKVLEDKQERYWNETIPQVKDFATGAAVAARAEEMRLKRISAITNDTTLDKSFEDIQQVFAKILPQEQFHAKAFAKMAGNEAMKSVIEAHKQGMVAIGLIPDDF